MKQTLHPLLLQFMGTPEAVKQLDASIDGQELPALWGMGGDELVVCKPATHTLVAFVFGALNLSAVDLYRFSKEVGKKVQSTWGP